MNNITLPNIQIIPEYHTMEEKKTFLEKEAERMRKNPTEGELLFKSFCDKYDIHYKFQVPVTVGYKGFILDFVIITKNNPNYKGKKRKINVEIDGEYHNTKEQKEKDDARTKRLKVAAYHVVRLTNDDVKDENTIIKKLLEFLPKIKEEQLKGKLVAIHNSKCVCTVSLSNKEVLQKTTDYKKEIETLKRLLLKKDKEILYWKTEYQKLYKDYKKMLNDLNF